MLAFRDCMIRRAGKRKLYDKIRGSCHGTCIADRLGVNLKGKHSAPSISSRFIAPTTPGRM